MLSMLLTFYPKAKSLSPFIQVYDLGFIALSMYSCTSFSIFHVMSLLPSCMGP